MSTSVYVSKEVWYAVAKLMCKENDWSAVYLCVVPPWQCGHAHILDTSSKLYTYTGLFPVMIQWRADFGNISSRKLTLFSFFLKWKLMSFNWQINYQRCMHFGVNWTLPTLYTIWLFANVHFCLGLCIKLSLVAVREIRCTVITEWVAVLSHRRKGNERMKPSSVHAMCTQLTRLGI